MSLSSILALVDARHGAATLKTAELAGAALSAPVDALIVKRDARDAIPMVGEGISGEVVQQIMSAAERDAEEAAAAARAVFDANPGLAGAGLTVRTGRTEEVIASHGRCHGLTVLPCAGQDDGGEVVIEAALFETGRPALIAPLHLIESVGKRVAIFWNDSPEAAKAVWGAMPFLRDADAVNVFSVAEDQDASAALDRIGAGLSRAGVAAKTVEVAPNGDGASVQLVDAAAAMDADLVVMGAFTHSRFRELVLGGVTRDMLLNLARPTLMAH